jgi:hypothetical protein
MFTRKMFVDEVLIYSIRVDQISGIVDDLMICADENKWLPESIETHVYQYMQEYFNGNVKFR